MTFQATTVFGKWLPPSIALNRFNPPQNTGPAAHSGALKQRKRFGFSVGLFRLLISPDIRSEVTTQIPVHSIPNVPGWFLGVMNLRGNLLPVFDLHQLLETDQNGCSKRTILILDQGRNGVGVPIDGLPQSVSLGNTMHNVPPLPDLLQKHVAIAYTAKNSLWLDFDHQGFFTALGKRIAG